MPQRNGDIETEGRIFFDDNPITDYLYFLHWINSVGTGNLLAMERQLNSNMSTR